MSRPAEPGLRIIAIRLECRNVAATTAFYRQAFGAHLLEDVGGERVLALGAQPLLRLARGIGRQNGFAAANSTLFQHFAIVVSDMDVAMAQLAAVGGWTAISTNGPEYLPARSDRVAAFKFRDPDGHLLELLAFPPGAAPPPWRDAVERAQAAGGRVRAGDITGDGPTPTPFLGIDHSAITVESAERSIASYEGLGFAVFSRQINFGPEQARLDAVYDPQVEVIGLMPEGGAPPHLELLCYRRPTVLTQSVPDDDLLATRLLLKRNEGDGQRDGTLSDPDGHRMSFF